MWLLLLFASLCACSNFTAILSDQPFVYALSFPQSEAHRLSLYYLHSGTVLRRSPLAHRAEAVPPPLLRLSESKSQLFVAYNFFNGTGIQTRMEIISAEGLSLSPVWSLEVDDLSPLEILPSGILVGARSAWDLVGARPFPVPANFSFSIDTTWEAGNLLVYNQNGRGGASVWDTQQGTLSTAPLPGVPTAKPKYVAIAGDRFAVVAVYSSTVVVHNASSQFEILAQGSLPGVVWDWIDVAGPGVLWTISADRRIAAWQFSGNSLSLVKQSPWLSDGTPIAFDPVLQSLWVKLAGDQSIARQRADCPPGQRSTYDGCLTCEKSDVYVWSMSGLCVSCEQYKFHFANATYFDPQCATCSQVHGPGWGFDANSENPKDPCVLCSPDFYSSINDPVCLPCPPNTFSNISGLSSCLPCPIGTFSFGGVNSIDDGSCEPCPPGTYIDPDGGCSLCPPRSYSGAGSSSQCTPCPEGKWCPGASTTPIRRFPFADQPTVFQATELYSNESGEREHLLFLGLGGGVSLGSMLVLLFVVAILGRCTKRPIQIITECDWLYSLKHATPLGSSPVKKKTFVGGFMTLSAALTAMLLVTAVSVEYARFNVTYRMSLVPYVPEEREEISITFNLSTFGQQLGCFSPAITSSGIEKDSNYRVTQDESSYKEWGMCSYSWECRKCKLIDVSPSMTISFGATVQQLAWFNLTTNSSIFGKEYQSVVLVSPENRQLFIPGEPSVLDVTVSHATYHFKNGTKEESSFVQPIAFEIGSLGPPVFPYGRGDGIGILLRLQQPNVKFLTEETGKVSALNFVSQLFSLASGSVAMFGLVLVFIEACLSHFNVGEDQYEFSKLDSEETRLL